jgi:hypothetical protein
MNPTDHILHPWSNHMPSLEGLYITKCPAVEWTLSSVTCALAEQRISSEWMSSRCTAWLCLNPIFSCVIWNDYILVTNAYTGHYSLLQAIPTVHLTLLLPLLVLVLVLLHSPPLPLLHHLFLVSSRKSHSRLIYWLVSVMYIIYYLMGRNRFPDIKCPMFRHIQSISSHFRVLLMLLTTTTFIIVQK